MITRTHSLDRVADETLDDLKAETGRSKSGLVRTAVRLIAARHQKGEDLPPDTVSIDDLKSDDRNEGSDSSRASSDSDPGDEGVDGDPADESVLAGRPADVGTERGDEAQKEAADPEPPAGEEGDMDDEGSRSDDSFSFGQMF